MPSDETHVVIAVDSHANLAWICKALPPISRHTAGVRTILKLGGCGIWAGGHGRKALGAVDFWCGRARISRVLVTLGNHEDWFWLDDAFASQPGNPAALSPVSVTEATPRGEDLRLDLSAAVLPPALPVRCTPAQTTNVGATN